MKLSQLDINAFLDRSKIDSSVRFGMQFTSFEIHYFLRKIDIENIEKSIDFIAIFITSFLDKIPFQNYTMHQRGFGHIPTIADIKEDMLSLQGGTCATINTFVGGLLYNLGFDTHLIHGTMQQKNDHIAILLYLNNRLYTIDLGDGQPYFSALPINEPVLKEHPFRTYRTTKQGNNIRIDFLIRGKWSTDAILHLSPKTFEQIYSTLQQHYTQRQFGPFWSGVRFAIYPNKKIIAIRDKVFILQESGTIKKIEIKDKAHLEKLTTQYLPTFKTQIIQCFTQLQLL